jgi:hypothetical protein
MERMPPSLSGVDFGAIETSEDQVEKRFYPVAAAFWGFLNGLPCLASVQDARCAWVRPKYHEAFGSFKAEPGHWYSFHHGGRNEAQFNIGMFSTHFRVGLGFEFSERKGGDPTVVGLVYSCFCQAVRKERPNFETFLHKNNLEVEWWSRSDEDLSFVSTDKAVDWLLDPPQTPWIFIGRLLRSPQDRAILERPAKLAAILESVLCGFRSIWEETQLMARRYK